MPITGKNKIQCLSIQKESESINVGRTKFAQLHHPAVMGFWTQENRLRIPSIQAKDSTSYKVRNRKGILIPFPVIGFIEILPVYIMRARLFTPHISSNQS